MRCERLIRTLALAMVLALLLAACATKKAEDEAPKPEDLGVTDRVLFYQNEIKSAPDNPEFHYKLGNALLDMGRHQDAYSAYQRAIELKPDYADAFANLGLALRKAGNLKAAAGAYMHALDLKPDDVTTLSNLAVVAQLMEDSKRSLWCYERLVKLDPEDNGLLAGYADLLYSQGEIEEALPLYAILAARKVDAVRSQYRVGLCYFDLARFSEAVEAWEQARALEPDNASVNRGIAVALWQGGNLEAARNAVTRCQELGIALDPGFIKELESGPPAQADRSLKP